MIKLIGEYARTLTDENGISEVVFRFDNWVMKRSAKQLVGGTIYSLEIKEPRDKRSLNQNALFWVIVGDIAKDVGMTDEEVYPKIVERTGTNFEVITAIREAIPRLKETFRAVVELPMLEDKEGGLVDLKVFFGSSKFNKKEMSELIEKALYYAEQVGIDATIYEAQMRGIYYD